MKLKPMPNINHCWAALMIEELVRNGITYFCIAPGSRSTPLTMAVAQNPNAQSIVHFDERGLGFHALGYTSAHRHPCAVITTSGTAVANLYPAIIEASKKKLPLIILTADRPPELRMTGSNQTIDQVNIFGNYTRWFFDMPTPNDECPPEFVLTTIDQAVSKTRGELKGPVHLNCMYREPLAPTKTTFKSQSYMKSVDCWQNSRHAYTTYLLPKTTIESKEMKDIADKISSIKNGVILVGKLSSEQERNKVIQLSEKLQWPIFADIASGLRLGSNHKNVIHYFDLILKSTHQKSFQPDGVIQLGGRMTSKECLSLIENAKLKEYIMILNHPLRNDPTHKVTLRVQSSVTQFCSSIISKLAQRKSNPKLKKLQSDSLKIHQSIADHLYNQRDCQEGAIARVISEHIPNNHGLFVSNSLPIRHFDTHASIRKHSIDFTANRGASGIDGNIATAIGFNVGLNKPITAVIGDLAFLHDMNSLAMLKSTNNPTIFVVINNNGGGIFHHLPITNHPSFEKYFGTPHQLTFQSIAEMFDLNYIQTNSLEQFQKSYHLASQSLYSIIIEVQTNRSNNVKILEPIQKKVKTLTG